MITVRSTEDTPLDLELTAFPMPNPSRNSVAFHSLSSLPEYVPVLVQITSKDKNNDTITYIPLNTSGNLPAPSAAPKAHTLSLASLDDVWRRLPSTLDGWDAVTNPCALLFVSEAYLNGGDVLPDGTTQSREDVRAARPVVAGGCPKWPCGTGDLREALGQIAKLKSENKGLLDELAGLQATFASLGSLYGSLKQQVTELKPTLTPDQLAKVDLTRFL